MLRFPLTAACLLAFSLTSKEGYAWALGLFLLACLSDFLDGFLARRMNVISAFGKLWDPIADKFLTLGCFTLFSMKHIMPWWALIIIAGREILLTVIRVHYSKKYGTVFAALSLGKLKTVIQMVFISFVFIMFTAYEFVPIDTKYRFAQITTVGTGILLFATVMITLISGAEFFLKNDLKVKQ